MFLTVTPNACLDRVLFIDRFVPTGTMRTRRAVDAVGGKGFDISVALRGLGQETVAVGFRAGVIGAELEQLLLGHGIQADLVDVPGETRIAHVIIEEELHRHSHITTRGYSVDLEAYQPLLGCIQAHLPRAAWLAAGGSLPDGLPEDTFLSITRLGHDYRVPVLLDISGAPALAVLTAKPEVLKMNRQEFQETFSENPGSIEDLAGAAARLAADHDLPALVITCGKDGILSITPHSACLARGPALDELNAAGAGDAASAGLIWRLSLGEDWPEALRWAAAAGAAAVQTAATAECPLQLVRDLVPRVEVIQY
jgi:1-phosphofructokinase family hexose kinase